MEHKGWTQVILQGEGHGDDSGNLCHHQGRCQGCVNGGVALLVMRVFFCHCGCFASGEDGQAHITADQEFTQGLGIDVPVASSIITEAEIRLGFDATEWCSTSNALAFISVVEHVTILRRTDTTICSMSIKVNDVAGESDLVVVKGTCATAGVEITHEFIKGGRF